MSTVKGKSPAETALFDIAELDKQIENLRPIEEQIIEQAMAACMRGEIVRLVSDGKTIAVLDASGTLPHGFDFTGMWIDEANTIPTRFITRDIAKKAVDPSQS